MKKPSKSYLTNKLDKECQRIVRSKGQCVKCKRPDALQTAHIFSRTYKSVRWNLLNMLCLCAGCHRWAHNNPVLFTEWVKNYLGEYNYELLKNTANPTSHWTIDDLQKMLKTLEALRTPYAIG